jgi:hypothetical protein
MNSIETISLTFFFEKSTVGNPSVSRGIELLDRPGKNR